MTKVLRYSWVLALSGVVLGACRSREPAAGGSTGASTGATAASAGRSRGIPGMPGMSGGGLGGMMMGTAMMDSMRAQMRGMQGMSPAQMRAALPAHRQMLANVLAQMNQEMRSMNMQPGADWIALTDSIRQDLIRMPDMSPQQLHGFMDAHAARVMRLMDMHARMQQAPK